jgi:hypothetical protein
LRGRDGDLGLDDEASADLKEKLLALADAADSEDSAEKFRKKANNNSSAARIGGSLMGYR